MIASRLPVHATPPNPIPAAGMRRGPGCPRRGHRPPAVPPDRSAGPVSPFAGTRDAAPGRGGEVAAGRPGVMPRAGLERAAGRSSAPALRPARAGAAGRA